MGTVNGRLAKEHEIPYDRENPQILKIFLDEVARNGGKPKPLEEWRK